MFTNCLTAIHRNLALLQNIDDKLAHLRTLQSRLTPQVKDHSLAVTAIKTQAPP